MTADENPLMRYRQTIWVVGCRIVGILSAVGANILAARILGPSEFGRYLFAFSIVVCGSLLAAGGLADAVLRFTAESLAMHRPLRAIAYTRHIFVYGAVATLAGTSLVAVALTALYFSHTGYAPTLGLCVLTLVTLVALAWQQLAAETLRGWKAVRLASLFSGGTTGGPVSTLVFLVGLAILLVLDIPMSATDIIGLLMASVCATVPVALGSVAWTLSRQEHHAAASTAEHLTRNQRWQLISMAGTVLAINLLAFFGEQMDIWIGTALLAPDQLGVYGVAKRSMVLTSMPVQMAMLAIISEIPRLHTQQRFSELQHLMRSSAGLAAIPALAAVALLVLFPETILSLLFGGSYGAAAPLIRILALGQAALIFVGNPSNVLCLTGSHRIALLVNLVAATAIIITGPLAAYQFGVTGLAWAMSLCIAMQYLLQWWLVRQRVGIWTHVGLPTLAELRGLAGSRQSASDPHLTSSGSGAFETVHPFTPGA